MKNSLGLFACVEIPNNTNITIYMGKFKTMNTTERGNTEQKYMFHTMYKYFGPRKSSPGELDYNRLSKKTGVMGSTYDALRDDRETWSFGDELYLGAHMIKDVNLGKIEGCGK